MSKVQVQMTVLSGRLLCSDPLDFSTRQWDAIAVPLRCAVGTLDGRMHGSMPLGDARLDGFLAHAPLDGLLAVHYSPRIRRGAGCRVADQRFTRVVVRVKSLRLRFRTAEEFAEGLVFGKVVASRFQPPRTSAA